MTNHTDGVQRQNPFEAKKQTVLKATFKTTHKTQVQKYHGKTDKGMAVIAMHKEYQSRSGNVI
ncbi:MAG TPA: hypothetical protein DEQ87_17380 [Algoriphagus sp.]|jgi:hypothetical protein|uniref:hypothetical protein n=1 Tax=unclassified Algoriphagus TaxID=2641541 RepID=UPI000E8635B4|nr:MULTISPECIES: hypothetical protein [unclassified Algoriphagus]HAS59751.1 hypothetical protein [Algoriphagus sp.]HCD89389.1 hypothetical protein [Algoriphagus sp.]|tara:strand:- start:488 stop:676 length:189 start_codon:yes stop_codon:yes gene_type:complete